MMGLNIEDASGKIIGLYGGSFNPAHEGHLFVIKQALRYLNIDELWVLPSVGNPLKNNDTLASYKYRLRSISDLVLQYEKVFIKEFEFYYNINRTIDVVILLKSLYKTTKFVWFMGSDCLSNFHLWYRWEDILKQVLVVCFARPDFILDSDITNVPLLEYLGANLIKVTWVRDKIDLIKYTDSFPKVLYIEEGLNSQSSSSIRKSNPYWYLDEGG